MIHISDDKKRVYYKDKSNGYILIMDDEVNIAEVPETILTIDEARNLGLGLLAAANIAMANSIEMEEIRTDD